MKSSWAMLSLLAILIATVFAPTEAIRSHRSMSRSQRMQLHATLRSQREAAMAAMPVQRALDIFAHRGNTSSQLISLVQKQLGHRITGGKASLRKGVPKPDEGTNYGTGTEDAVVRINEMILETIEKFDSEELRCEARFEELEQLLVEVNQDLATFQVSGSEAAATKLDAFAAISNYEVFIAQTDLELKKHQSSCKSEKADLHQQLLIIKKDRGVMDKILNMTDCSDQAYDKANALLLQCKDKNGATFTRLKVTKAVAAEFAKFKHETSKQLTDAAIVVESEGEDGQMVLLEQHHRHRKLRKVHHSRKGVHNHTRKHKNVVATGTDVSPQGLYPGAVMNASETPVAYPDQPPKCSIANSAKCPELRERFMNIAGGIADAQEEMELMIGNLQTRCLYIENNIKGEINHYEIYLQQQQAKEAQAVGDFGAAQSATTKKNLEKVETEQILAEERSKCSSIASELKTEQCALDKIRDQLLNMSNLNRHIVDCEVSVPWEYGTCSASCAGGVRVLSRDIDVQAGPGPEDWDMGHKCPLVKAQQTCNTERCPVDCMLSDWAEWGQCSKVCDGGSRERMRRVVHPAFGAGMPCETKIESEDCNVDSCQKDCQLSDWTEWSTTCSKQCGGGQQTSFKTLLAPAEAFNPSVGSDGGECPHFYDESRFRKKPCNVEACPYTKSWAQCRAKVDVVLLVDGSASAGADGFKAMQTFAANFARALVAPAHVATLVFSGPADFAFLDKCEGHSGENVTLEQCGMNWVNHLEVPPPDLYDTICDAEFPANGAMTSLAIDLAAEEFLRGSSEHASVAILITDGAPVRRFPMESSVKHLKSNARLMEVVIGQDAYSHAEEFKGWASAPWQNNVRFVQDWADLTSSNETINAIIEDFCTDMVFAN